MGYSSLMTEQPSDASNRSDVTIGLNAVLATVEDERPKVLCVYGKDRALNLPYGPFDPTRHRTFEIGLREWVTRQTHITLGYVEQLYTFGDMGRQSPTAAFDGGGAGDRVISVGYLALAPEPAEVTAADAAWRDWYEFFPWEDWRRGEPPVLSEIILPSLAKWAKAGRDEAKIARRHARIRIAFGKEGWEEERVLDRYELMYEAGLVAEACRDRSDLKARKTDGENTIDQRMNGLSMASDHRRILATAIGRVRGKLKYRPVIYRLTPPSFTLFMLQKTVEALIGFELHKQNFRRSVESGGYVDRTEETTQQESGRPAALFKASPSILRDRAAGGLTIPRMRLSPEYFVRQ